MDPIPIGRPQWPGPQASASPWGQATAGQPEPHEVLVAEGSIHPVGHTGPPRRQDAEVHAPLPEKGMDVAHEGLGMAATDRLRQGADRRNPARDFPSLRRADGEEEVRDLGHRPTVLACVPRELRRDARVEAAGLRDEGGRRGNEDDPVEPGPPADLGGGRQMAEVDGVKGPAEEAEGLHYGLLLTASAQMPDSRISAPIDIRVAPCIGDGPRASGRRRASGWTSGT